MFQIKSTGKFEAAMKELTSKLTNANAVRVGFPAGATYPDGTSVPMVAAIQEYGAPSRGIPPRPFMRNTVSRHSSEWADFCEQAIAGNAFDARRTLGQLGEVIRNQLVEEIVTFSGPPNAPSTIKRKGFAAPLRDSGHMLDSITAEVE